MAAPRLAAWTPPRRLRGIGAIDVLAGVAIFATGLLALAALQMGLLARGAELRIAREAASLARLTLEWRRTAGYEAIPVGLGQRQWTERALLAAGEVRTLPEIAAELGLFGFDVTADVVAHLPDPAAPAQFRAIADPDDALLRAPRAAPAQYKDIVLTFYWTDRWGRSQSQRFETAVTP